MTKKVDDVQNTIAKLSKTLIHSLPKEEHSARLQKECNLENDLSEAIEKGQHC